MDYALWSETGSVLGTASVLGTDSVLGTEWALHSETGSVYGMGWHRGKRKLYKGEIEQLVLTVATGRTMSSTTHVSVPSRILVWPGTGSQQVRRVGEAKGNAYIRNLVQQRAGGDQVYSGVQGNFQKAFFGGEGDGTVGRKDCCTRLKA